MALAPPTAVPVSAASSSLRAAVLRVALATLVAGPVEAQVRTVALEVIGSARSHDPGIARAERAYAAGRWTEAASLFQSALDPADDSPAYRWELAQALFNARRHREAIAAYERALQLGVGDPATGAWQISRSYAIRGNRKQALRWLAHAIAVGFTGEVVRAEPAFSRYHDDSRFVALADSARAGSPTCRLPAARIRRAPAGEVDAATLTAARAFDAHREAVGACRSPDRAERAGAAGFEPATSRVTAGRSAN